MEYHEFIKRKVILDSRTGFEISDADIHPILKGHQRATVKWAVRGGRRAIFKSFGLGKTVCQLQILDIIGRREGGKQLIIAPLGVMQEFKRDAVMLGQKITFIRRTDEAVSDELYITNYESVRDGRLDPKIFNGVSLDEAAVLRSFGSKTYQSFLTLFSDVKYRFVATATPSPNRFKELIHYAGYLGIADTGQVLTRYFQRDSTKANNLTLYPHMSEQFWLWVSSWALFLQKPSDLCRRYLCQKENRFKESGSGSLLLKNGSQARSEMELGYANAIAGKPSSQDQAICSAELSQAAGALGPNMAEKELSFITSGEQCLIGAGCPTIKDIHITAEGGFQYAKDGKASLISGQTWGTHHKTEVSIESTIMATMSPVIADGQQEQSKQITDALEQNILFDSETCEADSCDNCPLNDGYDLPTLHVHYHKVKASGAPACSKDGQMMLPGQSNAALSLSTASKEKRDSLVPRIEKMVEIINGDPDNNYLLWHDQEVECHAIQKALPEAVTVYGSLDLEKREQRIIDFSDGKIKYLASKPVLSGAGCNFQRHCHNAIFLGIGFKFYEFIQSIHRIQRFLQDKECHIHIIYADTESGILDILKKKWAQHEDMVQKMTEIIKKYGLSAEAMESDLRRAIGVERVEVIGETFRVVNNDTVDETARMESESVDMIVTSIPFSNHYEYTPSYLDFGHTDNNDHFWGQMDFLTPNLLRVLRPGRIYACHTKDRINFGNVTGKGVPTVSPFHMEAAFHAIKHGFDYMGMITVVTDVVRENNQTYRLGWTENSKDGTKMGVGSPEYILLLRKPQTDRGRAYADIPVAKSKADYSRARWQVDAHAFWRSSGDRFLDADELKNLGPDQLCTLFTDRSLETIYDYEAHVKIGETLELKGRLPAKFMAIAPGSHDPNVWHDVNRMITLNSDQSRRRVALHVCPLQTDIVKRLIVRYSNEGETIYDPFGGIMTVPHVAVLMGRKGVGVELNASYFKDGLRYCYRAENKIKTPSLFDVIKSEKAA